MRTQSRSQLDALFEERLGRCIHCGLCLPACPTYEVFGTEMDAPRGRIALMSAVADGRTTPDGSFAEHIGLCLGCRACETACPSGVEYGSLLDTARALVETERKRSLGERLARWLGLRALLPHRRRLRLAAGLARLAQRTGLIALARSVPFLPARAHKLAALLPRPIRRAPESLEVAPAHGEVRGRVAFFRGCVQDAFLGDVNAATVRVLQRNGYEVHFPPAQTCCGAAAHHVGESVIARELAERNLAAFDLEAFDALINNAGGCGSMLKEYPALFAKGSDQERKAEAWSARVRDVCEFLAENLNAEPAGRIDETVVYADSCHLRHAQRVVTQPRQLLRSIPGLELVELEHPDACCGSAGVYNIVESDTADRVLDSKMMDLRNSGARIVATTNIGCHLQLLFGARRAGLDLEVRHVVELLDQAYAAAG